MAVAARLDWLLRAAADGHPVCVSLFARGGSGRLKARVTVGALAGMAPLWQRDAAVAMLQVLCRLLADMVVVDRGHKHSGGDSEVAFWASPAAGAQVGGVSCTDSRPTPAAAAAAHVVADVVVDEPAASAGHEEGSTAVKRCRTRGGASAWRVVGSVSDAKVRASAAFVSRHVRDLVFGRIVHGVIAEVDHLGQRWVALDDGTGYVAVSTVACDFPGLGTLPARPSWRKCTTSPSSENSVLQVR